ncbi:MAG: 4-alpha-glucanotransferase [Gammaproteobacteria bacterium 28-57-27]|nr:MAG: 4-alpha-glucanotransferase [Gammaproteobacteria bacterium 28-57-27]
MNESATSATGQSIELPEVLAQRRAGVLLHPSSLPSSVAGQVGGTLGLAAYRFVEHLAACGVSVWQMLPLGPTHSDGSPYQCLSSHAGSPGFIDYALLGEQAAWCPADATNLAGAWQGFERQADAEAKADLAGFVSREAHWLEDYALFVALREQQGMRAWFDWPQALREREPEALQQARGELHARIEQLYFEQYLFFQQWFALRAYAHAHGVLLFGDMPIYVAHDSAEVWAQPELFSVDAQGQCETVAGVPPDYFSATGQRWGNPLYRWERHEADGFAWWKARFATQLKLFDIIRIDHFRGLEAYWSIPAECETAMDGEWVLAPGEALLSCLRETFGALPVVAEDLGIITEEVTALRQKHGLPGMRILQFAFDGGADNPYLPHNHTPDSVVYTGTHDNDTTLGWWEGLDESTCAYVHDYLCGEDLPEPMPWLLIRVALESVAQLAIIPMQDLLELGTEARMNTPGTTIGNWAWQYDETQCTLERAQRMREAIALYGRLPG